MAHRERLDGAEFWVPTTLTTSPVAIKRLLLVGACLVDSWVDAFARFGSQTERLHFNSLPEDLPRDPEEYEFQLVSIPLRSVLPESDYFCLNYARPEDFEALLDRSLSRLEFLLRSSLRFNIKHNLVTFVANFFVPMTNYLGRFAPRYDLRNPVFFIECLNRKLDELVADYESVYLFDIDRLSAGLGRRYLQDDFVFASSHGSLFDDYGHDLDQTRFEPPKPLSETYERKRDQFLSVAWSELLAQYRTLRSVDSVKMVIVDLDDTLWRGVLGDAEDLEKLDMEGWPLGVIEALIYLRWRGIVLALVSKNEESIVLGAWPQLMDKKLQLSSFAFTRINWRPKAENIAEILQLANLLPQNVVFVDDNPVERASVEAAFPGIRTLGAHPYEIKRVLLWSSETQVPTITEESSKRTEMMVKQAEREMNRKTLTHEEFLKSLEVEIRAIEIDSTKHPRFDRVLELVNKTNQFNTNGKRWTHQEVSDWLESGKNISAFVVEDRFAKYGLVTVIFFERGRIEQFVMSCRVAGMEVERAALSSVSQKASIDGEIDVHASIKATKANLPVRDLYRTAGFVSDGTEGWLLPKGTAVPTPFPITFIS